LFDRPKPTVGVVPMEEEEDEEEEGSNLCTVNLHEIYSMSET